MKPIFLWQRGCQQAVCTLRPPALPLLNVCRMDIHGKTRNLCTYAGKMVLVVSDASQCGYTGQYKGKHDQYGLHRLVVPGLYQSMPTRCMRGWPKPLASGRARVAANI